MGFFLLIKTQSAGPMRTSNILMMPNQFSQQQNYPGNCHISNAPNNTNENILPSFICTKNQFNEISVPDPSANQRKLLAAPILPSLDSLIKNLSSESFPNVQNSDLSDYYSYTNNNNNNNNYNIKRSSINFNSSNGSNGYNNLQKINTQNQNQYQNYNYMHNNIVYNTITPINYVQSRNYPLKNENIINNNNEHINENQNKAFHTTSLKSNIINANHRNYFNNPIKFIINRGTTIYQGDHVSVRGSDSQVYFAILLDFWLTETGRQYCTLRWLIPKAKISLKSSLKDRFNLGPIHERVEAMEIILDIFYSPYRDQMSSEMIRRKFLSPLILNSKESESFKKTENGNANEIDHDFVVPPIDPPLTLIKAMNSIYTQVEKDHQASFEKLKTNSEISQSSHISENEAKNNEIQANVNASVTPIMESSELAAKMLLSMY